MQPSQNQGINQPTDGNAPIDIKAKKERNTISDLKRKRFASDTRDRRWLAVWSASVVTLWLASVMIIVFYNNNYVCLSDSALIMLLGTTTLNVLGLSFIVLRGHFQSSIKDSSAAD